MKKKLSKDMAKNMKMKVHSYKSNQMHMQKNVKTFNYNFKHYNNKMNLQTL